MYGAMFTIHVQIYLVQVLSMTDVMYDKDVVARLRYVHVHCKTILGGTV
jgi:hypothetical protein